MDDEKERPEIAVNDNPCHTVEQFVIVDDMDIKLTELIRIDFKKRGQNGSEI